MTLKQSGPGGDPRVVDRWEDGVGWIAHPDEAMRRASHALAVDGEVWLVDPVDAADVETVYADLGEVVGVVVGLDRHTRDAAAFARRHDVPVYVPRWMKRTAPDGVPVEHFDDYLPGTGYRAIPVVDQPVWKEVALYDGPEAPAPTLDPEARAGPTGDGEGSTLVVPESVGTSSYFLADGERLGVHPARRALPPRGTLGDLAPDRVLVGHGEGVSEDATGALRNALRGSRRRMPGLYAKTLREFLPV
ncbi:hypothetical protein BRD18_08520 [Halobacteriales archaeon SW_7_71_33]|nr:MAG: hypothetical protein BRD18_08520 [Halobacteriales archaeon SW_7_71_33]